MRDNKGPTSNSFFCRFRGLSAVFSLLLTVFSLLLTAFSLLLLTSCKDIPVPIETIEEKIDTTSHDFTWQIDTLGEGSSVLYDVAIIDENNIWVGGEIYLNDSTGQFDPTPYCLARWNGSQWQLYRLFYNTNLVIVSVRGILPVSSTDFWLAAGSIFRWGGSGTQAQLAYSRSNLSDPNATIEKLWGNSNQNIYGGGNAGSLVRWNGANWQKIESGTTLAIEDIWGSFNRLNSQWEILAAARDPFSFDRRILSVSTSGVSVLNDSGITSQIRGIWFQTGSAYYVVGDGIFYKRPNLAVPKWEDGARGVTTFYSNAVRGSTTGNVMMVGAFGDVVHYNGSSWKHYPELNHPAGSWYGVAVKGGLVVAVGDVGVGAAVLIGRQQ